MLLVFDKYLFININKITNIPIINKTKAEINAPKDVCDVVLKKIKNDITLAIIKVLYIFL